MTDSKQSGGLPTAAIGKFDKDEELVGLGYLEGSKEYYVWGKRAKENLPKKIEFLRRKDVKALIQDKIRQAEEKIEKYNAFDRLNLNDAKARKQELEKLLEELNQ